MSNPATKNNLESQHFLSFSSAAQARLTQCLRNDGANIRPFSAPSEAIEAIKLGLNRVQPKNSGMKRISDGQNTFGQSMADAVLVYKSNNGIVRTGQKLDNIVGRGTLARLDTELKNGGPEPGFKPVFPENGSTRWRFNFFCNKGIFGKGIFQLSVASTELQDVGNFDVREIFSDGGLASGFRGTCVGTFTTTKKVLAKQFSNGVCDFSITRGASSFIQGTMLFKIVSVDAAGRLDIPIILPRFRDETLGLTQGTESIRGIAGTTK